MQKLIPASPARLFRAWTNPEELIKWWGPEGVRCVSAEVDAQVGGRYRIGNELHDGSILWISGEFDVVDAPRQLRFTWIVETENPSTERVTVQFEPHEDGTRVILTHELIPTDLLRDKHALGWAGCMQGLADFVHP